MVPSPSSRFDDVLVLPDWTWNRLCGENGMDYDREDKRRYAKCLVVALEPNETNTTFYVRAHRGDALCIVEEDLLPGESLGGRKIVMDEFNLSQCMRWLETCQKLHGRDCEPDSTEELEGIRLVDVESRVIVAYPGSPCDYAALSYVWGGVEQPSYHLGSRLNDLPRTIEDALRCTKLLGKRYLWVDSLCIDQHDEKDKTDQIARMWSIYRGSSITIISLSSSSADSGLPRFNPADENPQPQLSCSIDGVRLVGLMPTLSQYIWTESWGSRAWTLQEALLSHRCLYLSDHQLYFECEVVQHCESLDESRSWVHNLTPASSPDPEQWLTWTMMQNGSGCLRNLLDNPADRLLHWGQKVTLYSYRKMTNQGDGLRAFSGVLQRLQTMYKEGFWWGLPIEDFSWALLWQAQWPPVRRTGFPSWCWAGWQVGIMTPFPIEVQDPHRSPVPLRIWRASAHGLMLLFDTKSYTNESSSALGDSEMHKEAPSLERVLGLSQRPARSSSDAQGPWVSSDSEKITEDLDDQGRGDEKTEQQPKADGFRDLIRKFGYSGIDDPKGYMLFMDVLTIQLQPDWSDLHRASSGLRCYFRMTIANFRCLIHIMSADPLISGFDSVKNAAKYLLLAMNSGRSYQEYQILVVLEESDFYTRGTSMSLLVPNDGADKVLQSLRIRHEYLILV